MTFIETIKSIINSDWFKAAYNILYPIASLVFVILFNLLKSKLSKLSSHTDKCITDLDDRMKNVDSNAIKASAIINDLIHQNETMTKDMETLTSVCTSLINTVSLIYMGSKAVDEKYKIQLGKILAKAEEAGLKVNEVIEHVAETNKETLQITAKVAEEMQEHIKESTEVSTAKANDTEKQTLELYNELVKNEY